MVRVQQGELIDRKRILAVYKNIRGNFRLRGQAVKTSPFHGGNTGSIPVGVILNLPMRRNLIRLKEVNRRQSADYKSAALPIEPHRRVYFFYNVYSEV